MSRSRSRTHQLGPLALLAVLATACGKDPYDKQLPDSSELGAPHGQRLARVITHYHSPYSYDACDKAGLTNGVPNASCLADLRTAVCDNRIDLLMLTDHPDNMTRYEFPTLLLNQPGDTLLGAAATPYANQMGGCANGFRPTAMVGFEDQLMALGMLNHLSGTPDQRNQLYTAKTRDVRDQLASAASALVFIPHTESRDVPSMAALAPDGIEIYNTHANLDPKIRHKWLGLNPFEEVPDILTYLIDPYGELNADYVFMSFFLISPTYFQKWDALTGGGYPVVGIGGTDSHENIFAQHASDGERLDAHRRLTRFMSNHVLASSTDPLALKAALKAGRSWVVIEGFGTPVGMDYFAESAAGTALTGDSISLASGPVTLTALLPGLHPKSPRGDQDPEIRAELIEVGADGSESVVADSQGGSATATVTAPGAFRAQVYIIPRHLKPYLSSFSGRADSEYPWIITNHIHVTP